MIETLRHAKLTQPATDGHESNSSRAALKDINILDLGSGCGDQTLCLAEIWRNASLRYVGLTLSQTQHSVARDRLEGVSVKNMSTIKIHCADAARPQSWTEEIMADVLELSPLNKSGQTQNWVLGLDTLYHFSPSRLPILSFAARELKASLMAVDYVRANTVSFRQRILLGLAFRLSGCPPLIPEAQYREMLVKAGYDPSCIEIVDITKHTFGPLSRFMAKQEAELRMIGLSLGKLRFASRLFAWFDQAEVVRAVIVVARYGKSDT